MGKLYNVNTRIKIVKILKRGINSVSKIAKRLKEWKGNIHYHLQNLIEQGAIVKLGKKYYLRKFIDKGKVIKELQDFRGSIVRKIRRKGQFSFYRFMEFRKQVKKWSREFEGIQQLQLTPMDLVKEKRATIDRVISGNYPYKNRKFEQLIEFKKLCRKVEGIFGIEVPKSMKKIQVGNPVGTKILKKALYN